jgi:hypothetical protein
MKTIILAFMLTTATMAQAQLLSDIPIRSSIPKTIKFLNPQNEIVGTATVNDNTIYFRDKNGEHYATMVVAKDGTKTFYDPSGKIVDPSTLSLNGRIVDVPPEK